MVSIRRIDQAVAVMSHTLASVGTRLSMPTLRTVDGTEIDLHLLRGKKVLLFIWGSW